MPETLTRAAAAHTPGPWEGSYNGRWRMFFLQAVGVSPHRPICSLGAGGLSLEEFAQAEADVALMAAAPTLLEAAETLLGWYASFPVTDLGIHAQGALAGLRAAVAMARGQVVEVPT